MKSKKKKDEALESLARFFGIEIKKVNPREMKGSSIVSVGRCQEGKDGELKVISSLITSYKEKENYKKTIQQQEENFRFAMQGMQEMGGKLGIIAELVPNEVAERSIKFADAMLEEAKKRKIFSDN